MSLNVTKIAKLKIMVLPETQCQVYIAYLFSTIKHVRHNISVFETINKSRTVLVTH